MDGPRRILVIDDSALIRHVVQAGLRGEPGWHVDAAESGPRGVELATSARPDLILLDVEMPDPDGPATLALLREREVTREVPVLFLTGHSADEDRRTLLALGAAGVIAKPFDPPALAAEIRRQMEWAQ